jgi:hypothetical protein
LSGPGDTHRLVLEGVPRVGFYQGGDQCPEQIPFPSCLAACLRYLGEAFPWLPLYGPDQEWRVNYGNVFLLGATGMAFGLLWRPGWHMDNAELLMMADPRQLIDRAFRCVGYSYRVIEKAGQPEDELRYRREIRESISTGRPVLAFGLISPTECGIITGFDEETDVLLGWDYYQDDPRFAGGHQIDPSGYFSKRDWFRQVRSLIVIGERENEPASAVDYLLSGALERVRTPAVYGRCSGLADSARPSRANDRRPDRLRARQHPARFRAADGRPHRAQARGDRGTRAPRPGRGEHARQPAADAEPVAHLGGARLRLAGEEEEHERRAERGEDERERPRASTHRRSRIGRRRERDEHRDDERAQ